MEPTEQPVLRRSNARDFGGEVASDVVIVQDSDVASGCSLVKRLENCQDVAVAWRLQIPGNSDFLLLIDDFIYQCVVRKTGGRIMEHVVAEVETHFVRLREMFHGNSARSSDEPPIEIPDDGGLEVDANSDAKLDTYLGIVGSVPPGADEFDPLAFPAPASPRPAVSPTPPKGPRKRKRTKTRPDIE